MQKLYTKLCREVGFYYGAATGGSFETIEAALGPVLRRVLCGRGMRGPRRARSAPRITAHAASRAIEPDRTLNYRLKRRMESNACDAGGLVAGYELVHPFVPMRAASATTFWNNFSSVQDTMARRALHAGYAALMYELGCREEPLGHEYRHLECVLSEDDILERAVIALRAALDGGMPIELQSGAAWSPLSPERWEHLDRLEQPLWAGHLWSVVRDRWVATQRKHKPRVLMKVGVADLCHLGDMAGSCFVGWEDFRRLHPELDRYCPKQGHAEHAALVAALQEAGVAPAPFRPSRPLSAFTSSQTRLDEGASAGQLRRRERRRVALSGDGGEALKALLTDGGAEPRGRHSVEEYRGAWANCMGEAVPCRGATHGTQAPSQLELDGGVRCEVHSYKKALPPEEREWHVRACGGLHGRDRDDGPRRTHEGSHWQQVLAEDGRSAFTAAAGEAAGAWMEDAAPTAGVEAAPPRRWTIGEDGWLLPGADLLPGEEEPHAVLFWRACEQILKKAGKTADPEEAQFVLNRLLAASEGVHEPYFVATDGTRKPATRDTPVRVGRVALMWDPVAKELRKYGGECATTEGAFERHSFEAELLGFHDALAAMPFGGTAIIVTDCLSGASAKLKFRRLSNGNKARCYRAERLEELQRLEDRLQAVKYMWCHSHAGITPNEAADVMADVMLDKMWDEPGEPTGTFQVARLYGVKRGIGELAMLAAQAETLHKLFGSLRHTLVPTRRSWQFYRNESVRGQAATRLRDHERDALQDLRTDRAGLWHDRSSDWSDRHSFGRYMRRQISAHSAPHAAGVPRLCACGRQVQQTRAHVLFGCGCGCGNPTDALRAGPAHWLARNCGRFGTAQARTAAAALSHSAAGLTEPEVRAAVAFVSGVPDTPEDKEDAQSKGFAAEYTGAVLRPVVKLLDLTREHNRKAVDGDGGKAWRLWQGRDRWWANAGHEERWRVAECARDCLWAWRTHTIQQGPLSAAQRRRRGAADDGGAAASSSSCPGGATVACVHEPCEEEGPYACGECGGDVYYCNKCDKTFCTATHCRLHELFAFRKPGGVTVQCRIVREKNKYGDEGAIALGPPKRRKETAKRALRRGKQEPMAAWRLLRAFLGLLEATGVPAAAGRAGQRVRLRRAWVAGRARGLAEDDSTPTPQAKRGRRGPEAGEAATVVTGQSSIEAAMERQPGADGERVELVFKANRRAHRARKKAALRASKARVAERILESRQRRAEAKERRRRAREEEARVAEEARAEQERSAEWFRQHRGEAREMTAPIITEDAAVFDFGGDAGGRRRGRRPGRAKRASKRAAQRAAGRGELGPEVGDVIFVYWIHERTWYECKILKRMCRAGEGLVHRVFYKDDNVTTWHDLREERWRRTADGNDEGASEASDDEEEGGTHSGATGSAVPSGGSAETGGEAASAAAPSGPTRRARRRARPAQPPADGDTDEGEDAMSEEGAQEADPEAAAAARGKRAREEQDGGASATRAKRARDRAAERLRRAGQQGSSPPEDAPAGAGGEEHGQGRERDSAYRIL